MKVINRSKGTVRFAFKESLKRLTQEPRKESLILMHFSYGKMRFKYSTNYYSCLSNWDYTKQRLRNKSEILNRMEVNNHLDALELAINKIVSKLDEEQEPVCKEVLKSKLDEFTNKRVAPVEKKLSFHEFCELFFNRKEGKIAKTTLRSYKQTKTLIDRYDAYNNTTTDFSNIDLNFYYGFISFLEDDDKSLNTIGKHIKNLTTILNSATDDNINTNLAFRSKEFKTFSEETTAIYLNESEIRSMLELDLSAHPELEKSRDIFIIGYYTGQRVSDYNGLSSKDVFTNETTDFIKLKQKKTGNIVHCPITDEMRSIMIARYNGDFPSRKPEQKINLDLKEIARRLGINKPIKCVRTKGGQEVIEWIPKFKLVGTHTARRSFCTNFYKRQERIEHIMHFSGHKTTKEFYKYIRISKEEKSLHIAKTGMFNLAS